MLPSSGEELEPSKPEPRAGPAARHHLTGDIGLFAGLGHVEGARWRQRTGRRNRQG
jgi:hypothetical protein